MKKIVIIFYMIIFFILNTGCWDVKNINRMAFVTGLGIDLNEENQMEKYKITFEIIRPSGFKEKEGSTRIIQTIKAASINKAVKLIQAKISRPISLAHLRVLVVGEPMARKGFKDILTYVQKNPEIALRLRLSFTQDVEAVDVFNSKPIFEKTIAKELLIMSQLKEEVSLPRTRSFQNFATDVRSSNGRALGTRLILAEDNTIIRHGGAVFNNWKLIGWLSHEETRNANWILGRTNVIVDIEDGGNTYTYNVTRRSTKVIPIVENNEIRFLVKVIASGTMVEEQGQHIDLAKVENISKLENLCSSTITNEVQNAIYKAQEEFGVDYLDFGGRLKDKYPKLYKELDWEKVFPNIPIRVDVEARINRFGLIK